MEEYYFTIYAFMHACCYLDEYYFTTYAFKNCLLKFVFLPFIFKINIVHDFVCLYNEFKYSRNNFNTGINYFILYLDFISQNNYNV